VARKLDKVTTAPASGVVKIRSLHAIKRWRGFVRAKKDRSVLEQRAYFFLYYWLLKRSLSGLGQHALVKKRERSLVVKIEKASRLRLLVTAMQQWRVRLQLHQTLALWRRYVWQRRHQALLYRPIADVLTRKTHKRLLQLTFALWEKQHARNHAHRMLGRIIDRHLFRKVCEKAWRKWRSKVRQLTQLDSFQRGYQERRLQHLWRAWSERTREKERQDQLRRRAVRAHYLSLLRVGFNGFRSWRAQRQLTYGRVETMLDAADRKILASAFSSWDHFTSVKKTRALRNARASRYVEARLLNHVWVNGFRCFFTRVLHKKSMALAAQEHHHLQTVRRSFCAWKEVWQAERNRELALDKLLQDYTTTRERSTKGVMLENWSELARAKAARRVVNAQVRGQAQRRLLQKSLSKWVACVSVLRWQQITRARAEQHYRALISRKCFERWHHNVVLRRNYRKKTRAALIHWKLALQRTAFGGWKQYLQAKRLKQQRIHEALEFRHEHFVREGLRHWMTAALHLQEQREQRVTDAQASNTTHVWRRVAAIARHWRYLAIRRRTIRGDREALESRREVPRQIQENVSWQDEPTQPGREQSIPPSVRPPRGRQIRHHGEIVSRDSRVSDWTNERSPLSEFVMMPRNRPQPRRPIEVLLLSQADAENMPQANVNATVHEFSRCGFDFPAEPFTPLRSPLHNQDKPSASSTLPAPRTTVRDRAKRQEASPFNRAMPPGDGGDLLLPSTTARQLDVLERQLLALSQRKREWKSFQEHLEGLREAAAANPRLLSKLRAMEEQHAVRTKQWLHTKERIRSVAIEIQRLRSALQ